MKTMTMMILNFFSYRKSTFTRSSTTSWKLKKKSKSFRKRHQLHANKCTKTNQYNTAQHSTNCVFRMNLNLTQSHINAIMKHTKWSFCDKSGNKKKSLFFSSPIHVCFLILHVFRGPPKDHWALVSGLPTYVAENGFVSLSQLLQGNSLSKCEERKGNTRLYSETEISHMQICNMMNVAADDYFAFQVRRPYSSFVLDQHQRLVHVYFDMLLSHMHTME